jgi:hypothetical protein
MSECELTGSNGCGSMFGVGEEVLVVMLGIAI